MSADPRRDSLQSILELDKTIHEPARLAILSLLSVVRSADVLYVLERTGLTRGNLSAHIRKLEEAGFVEVEKKFVERLPVTAYHLTEPGRTAFAAYRATLAAILADLDA